MQEEFLLQLAETTTKYVLVNTRVDYQYRSTSLNNVCLYNYVRYYRKKLIDANDRKQLGLKSTTEITGSRDIRRGRPIVERESFQVGHPQTSSHINIKRAKSVIPVLLGPIIPRKDRDDTRERYCRAILTLFVPWRSIQDLCDLSQTWEQAFEARQVKIAAESNKIIDNIQLLHECKHDRDEHLQQVIQLAQTGTIIDSTYRSRNDSDSDVDNSEILDVLESIDMPEISLLNETANKAEQVYFHRGVQAVVQANRFAKIQSKSILFLDLVYLFLYRFTNGVNKTFGILYKTE